MLYTHKIMFTSSFVINLLHEIVIYVIFSGMMFWGIYRSVWDFMMLPLHYILLRVYIIRVSRGRVVRTADFGM